MLLDGKGVAFAKSISQLLGWLYFAAWSLSFYPQAILIHRRKSVAGVSLDFLTMNFIGFFCYSIFNLAFLFSKTVQQQYRNAHNGQENLVQWNDAIFAVHAFVIALWQYLCSLYYPRAQGQKVALWCRLLLIVLGGIFTLSLLACIVGGGEDSAVIRWLDFVNICSYIKLIITLVKYSPQIALNYQRRSTQGFAIQGIILDFTGGTLSLLQLCIDASIINHDWSDVSGDPGKLGLSFISLFFDVFLIVQHYFLYGSRPVDDAARSDQQQDEERQRLLG